MKKRKKLVIVGVGETAEIAYEYFTYDSEFEVVGFVVSKQYKETNLFCGLPVEDFEDMQTKYDPNIYYSFVAISSGHLNRDRTRLYNLAKEKGYKMASYISSKAFVWRNVKIGENCFVFENNVIQSNVEIGNNVTLWSGNHIGHRSIIRDNCFLSSHVVVAGFCEIGEGSFLGINSCVADYVKIAKDNFIGLGTVINKDTEENSIYTGNPAVKSKVSSTKLCKVK